MMGTTRADVELVRRGLARSRGRAAVLIAQGAVTVDGATVAKPSAPVGAEQLLDVIAAPEEFASRAGFKLDAVLDALGASVVTAGASCVDLGASTGGFTDVLLRRGAAHVDAVDVGHDQLVPTLRADPRVSVYEGVNARDLDAGAFAARPSFVVADLSFISLRLVLPAVARVLADEGVALVMVKPQFEVGRERLGSGGVVRDPALHVSSVVDVAVCAQEQGLGVVAVVPSPLPGPSGNREFFLVLRAGRTLSAAPPEVLGDVVRAAVAWVPPTVRDGEAPAVPTVHVVPGAIDAPGPGPEGPATTTEQDERTEEQ